MAEMKIIEESEKYGYRVGISEDGRIKTLRSPYHNYVFDTGNGMMVSWGRTQSEDPGRCPVPNILDMEISTICHHGCSFCFPEGTMVTMSDNTRKDIKDISVGDRVLSYDISRGDFSDNEVRETYRRTYDGVLVTIELENGQKVTATENHPFYVKGRGWVEAGDLTEEDEILFIERIMRIRSLSYERKSIEVYNFHCIPDEDYFANGVLVHNCYKSNLPEGKNMSFDTFRKIFDVQSRGLTQIAFGSGYLGTENPEVFRMMDYAREHGVIPNITVGYVSDESADLFASRVGAIAISCYESLDRCYDSVKRMTDRGVDQTNIHFMICEETYDRCMGVLKDITVDPRLEKLNAIVMLSLKTKGRAVKNGFHPLSQEKFDSICQYAMEHNIGLGFDSCSSLKASRAFGGKFKESIIPCESGLESSYINVDGQYFPCSFSEGLRTEEVDWTTGINVLECHTVEEFLDRVWNGKRTLDSMRILEGTCSRNECNVRTCPFYDV